MSALHATFHSLISAATPGVINHLWISSLVATLLVVFAIVAPMPARGRHAVLLVALFALLVPASLVGDAFKAAGLDLSNLAGRNAHEGDAVPGAIRVVIRGPNLSAGAVPSSELACMLGAAWLLGTALAIGLSARGTRAGWRFVATSMAASEDERRAVTAAARALGLRRAPRVVRIDAVESPLVIGIVMPLVLLPNAVARRVPDGDLDSIVTHEVAHVQRLDNLIALIQRLAIATLWFNPIVWWLDRRLRYEREAACDEAVIDRGLEPLAYAEAIANVCRRAAGVQFEGASAMSELNLKRRMEDVMRYSKGRAGLSHGVAVVVAVLFVIVAGAGSVIEPQLPVSAGAPPVDRAAAPPNIVIPPVEALPNGLWRVRVLILDSTSGEWSVSSIDTHSGEEGAIRKGRTADPAAPAFDVFIRCLVDSEGKGEAKIFFNDDKRLIVAEIGTDRSVRTSAALTSDAVGAGSRVPIDLELEDAALKDVLATFAQITNLKLQLPPEVSGRVTVNLKAVPLDDALDQVLRPHNLTFARQGDTLRIIRLK